jgi:hypothetical protein
MNAMRTITEPQAMTWGAHLAASVRGQPGAPPGQR